VTSFGKITGMEIFFLTGLVSIRACWHYMSKSGVYTDKKNSI